MTIADYDTTPDEPPWYQLIEGSLLQDPPPSYHHQRIQGDLYLALRCYLDASSIGEAVLAPFAVYLDEINAFQPDVLVVLKERKGLITPRGVKGPPDLVVEILSPSNRRNDLGPKRKVYARSGVKRLWIVDPDVPSVSDYDLPLHPEHPVRHWTQADPQPFTCPLLPGFSLDWGQLFR